ncbi:Histidine kinase-, DNA gyrase B-, and HSP90-like ATPase-like protein 3 [Elsinoe fawcettii]|nr:Histidine kinase-, DNA gyrase B-, and HSP90-like ATPase-like protein 3 [Elsinoe fawcettii]
MSRPWKTARVGPEDGPLWRADLIRPRLDDDSRSTVTTTSRIGSEAPSSLRDVGLLSFFDIDSRPTIAFDLAATSDGSYECNLQTYENAVFRNCYPDEQRRRAFLSESRTKIRTAGAKGASFSIVVQGRPCTCTVTSSKWLIVGWNTPADERDFPHLEALPLRVIRSLAGESATSGLLTQPEQDQAPWRRGADILGWTRFPNFIITPHMKRILEYPWHKTSMGPIESWSTVCKLSVSAMILNPDPRTMYWGPEFTTIYNEHCIPIFAQKHPFVLGSSPVDSWPETWSIAEPMFLKAMYEGKASKVQGVQCFLMRNGTDAIEETFFDSTFLPIPGVDGGGNGVLNQFSETTDQVIERRQQAVINGVYGSAWNASSVSEYWTSAIEPLRHETSDITYALLITPTTVDLPASVPGENLRYHLKHVIGFQSSPLKSERSFSLTGLDHPEEPIINVIRQAHQKDDEIFFLSHADGTLPESLHVAIADRGFGDTITSAAVIPVPSMQGGLPVGFLIIGLNPRRPFDTRSKTFVQVLRDSLTKAAATTTLPSAARNRERQLEELHQSLLQRLHQSTLESQRLKARFERMSGSAPVGMFMFSPDGKTAMYANDEYYSMLDLTKEELAQEGGWAHKIHQDDVVRVVNAFEKIVRENTPVTIEFRTKKDYQVIDEVTGHPISAPQHIVATCIPEFNEEGTCLNLQGWLYNVSHDRFAQRLLNSRLDEVTASKQNAENFIDMVSHEMRNPLSAILQSADGIVSMLEQSERKPEGTLNLTGETAESVLDASETIILCAQHQKRIVDDILTLSKLDSNLLVISPDKASPPQLLKQALKMFESQLARAEIRASVEVEPSVSMLDIDFVMMDSSRILQVVINLLTNAIKFTQHAKKRAIALCLSASLTKPGTSDVQYIPRRESRPRHSWSMEWGNGQELYLSFMVRDTGKGLTGDEMATLFQRFSQASPKTYKKYGGSGLGLFISRELTELQGGQIGVSSEAGKGSTFAFYVLVRRWLPCTPMSDGSGRRFVDIHTPTMLESPVAYSRRESSAMFDSTGSLASMGERTSPLPSPEKEKERKLSVLIVEDNVINQKVMAKQIRAAGHEVHVANHGLEALQFLQRTAYWEGTPLAREEPDYLNQGAPMAVAGGAVDLSVILMDLEMPVLDGLSCVKQIREMETRGEIRGRVPVIAVTANARSEQIAIALAAGMDEVVTKPFRIWQVLERARGLVARQGSGPQTPGTNREPTKPVALEEVRIDSVLANESK